MRLFLLMLASLAAATAQAASFNCQKATTAAEKAICSDEELSSADSRLGALYKRAKEQLTPAQFLTVQSNQRRWLAWRDVQCPDAALSCLIPLYEERISALEFRLSSRYPVSPAAQVEGEYQDAAQIMNLYVDALSYNRLRITIAGAEPSAGRWVCDFTGVADLAPDGTLVLNEQEKGATVQVSLQGERASVSETPTPSVFCGHGGSLSGTYVKKALPHPAPNQQKK